MGKDRGRKPLAQRKPHRLKNQVFSVWHLNELAEWVKGHPLRVSHDNNARAERIQHQFRRLG